ncbi:mitotic arrest deficient 1 like 1 L homeolog isoform X4 [Xenopus laevis]|uniref:Mitotic spindle assembly checkpoint protein MAD1 n=1 Tax=Xenopus laevis TaxID=8355 RepID=A0A8J1LPI8_XENLA|nr:mitotic arrest deficient 1 like 1 L homeolog isoform X4 [Xenopus laevis]
MDDSEDNTTVISTLRSFNKFLSQPLEGTAPSLGTSTSTGASLQMQFQQRFLLEDQAAQIRSKSNLIQVEREKMQMELSHKRARIELEKAASTNAKNYEREADRNQGLHTRIKALEEKENEFQNKLQEQNEMIKSYKKTIEAQSKKLLEKEDKLSESNENISVLKGKASELQWKIMNQEMQIKTQETEKQELTEQLEIHRKKLQESNEKMQALHELQAQNADNEQKIKSLEQKLSAQEQDAAIVKSMKSDLTKLPKLERELQQLRDENAYHREMKENNALLKEEVEGLRRAAERFNKMKEDLVGSEIEKEQLVKKLKLWENLEHTTGLNISARMLETSRQQLQEELLKVQSGFLEEKKRREHQEALVRRLQKRVLLLTKERDGMRAILDSYDSELTPTEHSPQLSRRLKEAEDILQKVQDHNAEMETQLSEALEDAGIQKQKSELLTAELKVLKSQMGSSDQTMSFTNEAMSALRLKIEELEAERGRLEEENKILEMRLESLNLQGCYDPSRTKVIHLSLNPASKAKQQRTDTVRHLQEECDKLREIVRILEGGAQIPDKLEATGSPQSSQELAGLPNDTHYLKSTELKKQVESAELKNQRLREVFQTKIHEFRTACYMLTGYRIDITTENQYRLTSMYGEHKEDNLLFKASGSSGGKMQLLETDFSLTLRDFIDLHLHHQNSIPAFLSAVTLDLFSRQTFA